jgi:two-component system response regulator TctD
MRWTAKPTAQRPTRYCASSASISSCSTSCCPRWTPSLKRRALTAAGLCAIDDRVSGLGLGADDYLVKPFDYRELEARVQTLLRRNTGHASNLVQVGGLAIDRTSRLAELDGKPLSLSRQEFALLEILASRPQRIFSKEELLNQLFSFGNEPTTNAVEQYVTRVRKKLQGSSVEIRTARGMGYQIATL